MTTKQRERSVRRRRKAQPSAPVERNVPESAEAFLKVNVTKALMLRAALLDRKLAEDENGVVRHRHATRNQLKTLIGYLAEGWSVTKSIIASNLTMHWYYGSRRRSPAFLALTDMAIEMGTDTLEDVLVDIAKVDRDTKALLALLKSRRPAKFSPQVNEKAQIIELYSYELLDMSNYEEAEVIDGNRHDPNTGLPEPKALSQGSEATP